MSETNTTNTVETTVVEAPKLTREQKLRKQYDTLVARIANDTDKAQDIVNELNNLVALASIDVGSAVVVKLGRKFSDKDTTRYENGTVVGVKEDEDGSKLFKVQYGTGFDADIAVVSGGALSLPVQETAGEAQA